MKFDAGRCSDAYEKLEPEADRLLPENLEDFLVELRARTGNSDDLVVQMHSVAGCQLAVVMFEGQISNQQVSQLLLGPLGRLELPEEKGGSQGVMNWLRSGSLLASDQKEARTLDEVLAFAMSGFAVVVVDGQKSAVALGYQGFSTRGVGEPSSEVNLRGSREGFCEIITLNVALVRRRIKSGLLTVESLDAGRGEPYQSKAALSAGSCLRRAGPGSSGAAETGGHFRGAGFRLFAALFGWGTLFLLLGSGVYRAARCAVRQAGGRQGWGAGGWDTLCPDCSIPVCGALSDDG